MIEHDRDEVRARLHAGETLWFIRHRPSGRYIANNRSPWFTDERELGIGLSTEMVRGSAFDSYAFALAYAGQRKDMDLEIVQLSHTAGCNGQLGDQKTGVNTYPWVENGPARGR